MGYYTQATPDGRQLRFKISGDTPTPTEQARISSIITGNNPQTQTQEQEPDNTPGFLSNVGAGIGRGVDRFQAGLAGLGEYAARSTEEGEFWGRTPQEYAEIAERNRQEAAQHYIPAGGFFDQEGFGAKSRFLGNVAGESLPGSGAGIAGLVAGAGLGSVIGGPIGAAVGGTGGLLLGSLGYMPQSFNENLETQIQQHGRVKDWDKAFAAAGASSAVESLVDKVTLGVAGILKAPGKKAAGAVLSAPVKAAIEKATEKATIIAARRIGATAATGAVAGATEEAIQSALTRWQAEMPLDDPEAKAEYLESAVVGGILEGVFGIAAGTIGGVPMARAQARRRAAEEEADLERQRMKAAVEQNIPANEALRPEPVRPPSFIEELESIAASGIEADTAAEQAAAKQVEPEVSQPLIGTGEEAPVTSTSASFSENEYTSAIEQLRDRKSVSPDLIKNTLKVGRPKARAIFDEMLRRDDATTTGSKNQYLSIKKPVEPATVAEEAKPYTVTTEGRTVGEPFKTEAEAREWAEKTGLESYEISEPVQLPEQTELKQDAERKEELTTREILERELGPYREPLQKLADQIAGRGRVGVELVNTVDPLYLRMSGVPEDAILDESTIVEGVAFPSTEKVLRNVVGISNDLIDPKLTPEEKQRKLNGVLTHELVHVLRNADLLKQEEWDALANHANKTKVPNQPFTWIERQQARHVGEDANIVEEAIAEMLRYHMENPTSLPQKPRGLIAKIADFLKKLFAFGQNHSADELINAILGGEMASRAEGEGGMGPRSYPGDPMFAAVRVDPFYSQAERFFQNAKQEKAPAKQWLGMIKGNIKKDEMVWLDLENWMNAWGTQSIPKGEILDYIRAASLDLKEDWTSTATTATDEELAEYDRLEEVLTQINRELEPPLKSNVEVWDEYSRKAKLDDRRITPFEIAAEELAANGNERAREFVESKAVYDELKKKVLPKTPQWSSHLQEGWEEYTTAAFYLPQNALSPVWEGNLHYEIENVIAFTRFTERTMDGKKVLFVDEIQSDLHQKAATFGTSNEYVSNRIGENYDELVDLAYDIDALNRRIEDMENSGVPESQIEPERSKLSTMKGKRAALQQVINEDKQRNMIPEAPLRTTWEDFVIKRLIRYAAENDFDAIAWHGEPDSVADTEQYNQFDIVFEEDQKNRSDIERLGGFYGIRRAYERALEQGDKEASDKIQELSDAIDDAGRISDALDRVQIPEEIMDKYFPDEVRGGQRFVNEDFNVTAIVNRYIQKIPRIAKQIGKKFGTVPYLLNPRVSEDAPASGSLEEFFYVPEDIFGFMYNYDIPSDLEGRLRAASQIIRNQRVANIDEAFDKAGIKYDEIKAIIDEAGDGQFQRPELDEYGNPQYTRWMMDLTEDLKDTALYTGFPMFSAIDPNSKSYSGFEQGKSVRLDAIDPGQNVETQVPDLPRPMFSAIDPNRKYEAMVSRQIARNGYNPYNRQKLAKARIYDRGLTPYGQKLENSEPSYAKTYITRTTPKGKTPIMGIIENPDNGKREPAVIHLGGDWRGNERGIAWPIGYGFNHAAWHFERIAKDTNSSPDKGEVLKTFILTMAKGGDLKMDRGNMGVLTYKKDGWRKPLRMVLQRTVMKEDDEFFKKGQPVWKFITAYTDDSANDVFYSAVNIDPVPQYSATAPMGERVPLATEQDALEKIEARTTYNNLARNVQKLSKFLGGTTKYKFESNVEGAVIALQDRMLSVGDLMDKMRKGGGKVSNESDTYLRETLFSGQTDEMLHDSRRLRYTPIIRAVHALPVTKQHVAEAKSLNDSARSIMENYRDKRVGVAELYIYARHAQERNAEMRKRNEDLKDIRPDQYNAGSGMTDDEAALVLEWVESLPYADKISDARNPNSIRSLFRKIIANTNDVRVEAGLNPDFRGMTDENGMPMDPYEDYAPLRNWIDEHFDDDKAVEEFANQGKGFRVMGREDRAAVGRRSLGSDLIAHSILQNEEAIIRANKNKVGASFLKLLRDNPEMMADVAEVMHSGQRKFVYNKKTGKVRAAPDQSYRFDPSVLTVKEGGKETFIKIKDPRIARAMNHKSQVGSGPAGAILKFLLGLNRVLANTRTAWNPEFMINNMLKDLTAALTNLSEAEIPGLRRSVVRDLMSSLRGVREGEIYDTANTEWGKVYKEFKEFGGKTAFYGIRELEDTVRKINSELEYDASGSNTEKVLKPLKSLANFVEAYNVTIENGVRVSTYKNLRDYLIANSKNPTDPATIKRARERAAFVAKNLTVNFNMGGEMKPLMNAMYLFYNAGIQGSMALVNPLIRSKRVRKIWGTILAAGLMQDILMSVISPEDEDGQKIYDKIPDFILENNFIIMDPFGLSERGYFKMPLPYVLNGVWNAGRTLSAASRGKYTVGEAFNSIGGTLLDSLNPLGGSNSFLNFVAPTVADPFVDMAQNENFTGAPIAPPASPFGVPEKASQRYWNNTSPAYVTVADWLSKLTGSKGDYLPGYVEYSPNQIEYMFEWLGGGALTFARRMWDFASPVGSQGVFIEAMSGGEWSANDVPMLRRFYGNVTSRNDLEYYIKNRDKVMAIRAELNNAKKDGNAEQYTRIIQNYPREYRLVGVINALESQRRKLSQQIKKIRESKNIPDDRKKELIDLLKEKQEELVGRSNQLFRTE